MPVSGTDNEMTKRDLALEPFDALVGTWDTEAKHVAVDEFVPGTTTFQWLEGGHFWCSVRMSSTSCFPTRSASLAPQRAAKGW